MNREGGRAVAARVSARRVRETLAREYPGGDVQVAREFGGGLHASVSSGAGGMTCFSVAGRGVLAALLLGADPDDDPDGGGETAPARLAA